MLAAEIGVAPSAARAGALADGASDEAPMVADAPGFVLGLAGLLIALGGVLLVWGLTYTRSGSSAGASASASAADEYRPQARAPRPTPPPTRRPSPTPAAARRDPVSAPSRAPVERPAPAFTLQPEFTRHEVPAAEAALRAHLEAYNRGQLDQFVAGFAPRLSCWFGKSGRTRAGLKGVYRKIHFSLGSPHQGEVLGMGSRAVPGGARVDYRYRVVDTRDGVVTVGNRIALLTQRRGRWLVSAWDNPETDKACLR